ncbi:MAG TPA: GNAT family N-acetyltransferase [bacterium]|nr:GNAT family N-acetyltransferase [bacterium]
MNTQWIIETKAPGDEKRLAELLSIAFNDKYSVLCGKNRDKAIGILTEEMKWRGRSGNLFEAVCDGYIVGAVEILSTDIPGVPDGVTLSIYLKHLGLSEGLRAIYLLSLLGRAIDKTEACITHLAVDENHKRRGVARSLLAKAESFAAEKDKKSLVLWVSESNKPAIALYESENFSFEKGFVSQQSEKHFGYRRWLKLKKDLC